jgi:hypothetical protein
MANLRPWTRTLYVEITATAKPCEPAFKLKGVKNFKNNHRPGFILYFDIDDPDGTGCVFDSSDPLWVDGVSNPAVCPPAIKNWDEFQAVDVINQGQTLMVRNKNINQKEFSFMFRFRRPGCPNVITFDPIGNNENGSQN